MPANAAVKLLPILLRADPARVVIRPFIPADDPQPPGDIAISRAQRIANRVLALDPGEFNAELTRVLASLSDRHRDQARTIRSKGIPAPVRGSTRTGRPASITRSLAGRDPDQAGVEPFSKMIDDTQQFAI